VTSAWNTPIRFDHRVHDRRSFDSGRPELDEWIKRYARQSQDAFTAQVFVASPVARETVIAGFYSLHLGALERTRGSDAAARRSPDPIPALVMGRLAVDRQFAGQGLGGALLRDALERTLLIARNAGVKILLVHAKDDAAKLFYLRHGFEVGPVDALTLMLLVQDIPGA